MNFTTAHRSPSSSLLLRSVALAAVSVASLSALPSPAARAAIFLWDGGGLNNNFDTPANWNPNLAPPSDGTADLQFAGSTRLSPNAQAAYDLRSLSFNSGAGAFTIGGSALTIRAGGITQNSANTQTINNAVNVGADQTWTLASGAGALSVTGPLALGTSLLTVSPAAGTSATFSGAIDSTIFGPFGPGSLTMAGPGTLTFSGAQDNTFNGPLVVTAGTLQFNKSAGAVAFSGSLSIGNVASPGAADSVVVRLLTDFQIPTGAPVTIFSDGLLDINSQTDGIGTLTMTGGEVRIGTGRLVLSGNVAINASAAGAQITSTDFNTDVSLNGVTRTFTVANGAATYDLDVQAGFFDGTLIKAGAGLMRLAGSTNTSFAVTVNAGTVAVANNNALGTSNGTFTLAGGTVVADGADRSVPNPVNVTADSTVGASVDGTPRGLTFTGATTLASGATLTVSNPAATAFTNTVSGAGAILKTGPGTLTLSGATNSFSGGLTINGGTLSAAGDGSLGGATNIITVNAGNLNFTGANVTTARAFLLNNAAVLNAAAGSTLTYGSGATVNGGNLGASGAHLFSGGSALNGTTGLIGSSLNQTSGTVAFSNVTVRGGFTQAPSTTLNAINGLLVTSSGTLSINGTTNFTGGAEINGVAAVNFGGTVALTGSSSLFLGGGSRTTINSGGTISAAAGTSVELNGGLLVNNGTQSGTLNVNFGSLTKGSGAFGTVNVNDGGRFSPGNSPGSATLASATFGAGGRYDFELSSANATPGVNADLLNVTGALDITAGTTANSVFTIGVFSLNSSNQAAALGDFDPSQAYTFLLVDAGTLTGFAAGKFVVDTSGFLNNTGGGSFSVAQQGSDLVLRFTPVPEPGTWAMIAGGLGALLVVQRRRIFARRR